MAARFSWQRLVSVARKEIIHILRDRQTLLIRTVHAQGRIVADAVAPLLGGSDNMTFDESPML